MKKQMKQDHIISINKRVRRGRGVFQMDESLYKQTILVENMTNSDKLTQHAVECLCSQETFIPIQIRR